MDQQVQGQKCFGSWRRIVRRYDKRNLSDETTANAALISKISDRNRARDAEDCDDVHGNGKKGGQCEAKSGKDNDRTCLILLQKQDMLQRCTRRVGWNQNLHAIDQRRKKTAQLYSSRLVAFRKVAIEKGLRTDSPAANVAASCAVGAQNLAYVFVRSCDFTMGYLPWRVIDRLLFVHGYFPSRFRRDELDTQTFSCWQGRLWYSAGALAKCFVTRKTSESTLPRKTVQNVCNLLTLLSREILCTLNHLTL